MVGIDFLQKSHTRFGEILIKCLSKNLKSMQEKTKIVAKAII